MAKLVLIFATVALGVTCATGWGWLAGSALKAACGKETRGPMACLGLAVILGLCSALNALHALTPASFVTVTATGLVAFVTGLLARCPWTPAWSGRRIETGLLFLVATLLGLPLIARGLGSVEFSNDDTWAYLVAVRRVLDQGTLGADPFNYRLLVAGAGGLACLQAPAVALAGWSAVRVVDQGLGLALLVTALAWLMKRRDTSWPFRLVALVGFFCLATHEIINTTSYYLTLAVLVALFGFLAETENSPVSSGLCVGILISALAALKYTAMPSALLVVGLVWLHRSRANWRNGVRQAAAMVAAAGVPLLLWYLPRIGEDLVRVSLLHGSGQDQVGVGFILWWMSTRPGIMGYGWVLSLLVLVAVSLAVRGRPPFSDAGLLLVAVIAGCAATTWFTGGAGTTRFARPVVLFACLVMAVLLGARAGASSPPRRVFAAAAVLLAFALCNDRLTWLSWPIDYRRAAVSLCLPLPPDRYSELDPSLGPAQAVLEPGTGVLVRADRPHLLDFARNRFHVVDIAYGVSPGPGLGSCKDVSCLAAYLKAHSIRYVVYSHGNEANLSSETVARRLADPAFTPWQRAFNRRVPEFHALLSKAMVEKGTIFDDGKTAVVDLAGLVTNPTTCGIPSDAVSLTTNVTVDAPTQTGEMRVYPADAVWTGTSVLSFRAGVTRANNAMLKLPEGGSGLVRVTNSSGGTAHCILDVNGYFK